MIAFGTGDTGRKSFWIVFPRQDEAGISDQVGSYFYYYCCIACLHICFWKGFCPALSEFPCLFSRVEIWFREGSITIVYLSWPHTVGVKEIFFKKVIGLFFLITRIRALLCYMQFFRCKVCGGQVDVIIIPTNSVDFMPRAGSSFCFKWFTK